MFIGTVPPVPQLPAGRFRATRIDHPIILGPLTQGAHTHFAALEGFPQDARVVCCWGSPQYVHYVLEHRTFAVVAAGAPIPLWTPVMETQTACTCPRRTGGTLGLEEMLAMRNIPINDHRLS
jgi:hypothetical protein